MPPDPALSALVGRVASGEARAIAETLALVDDVRPGALDRRRELSSLLAAATPVHHQVVGLTGPPGAGKSSLAGALIRSWIDGGRGVGMVAVDPTSPRSGGALLGDRARLRFAPDEPVFVRSLATRDRQGGLAPAAYESVAVLRAAYGLCLLETVGVGQSDVSVERVADSVVLVLQPGSGDSLQFMKAGILEIPDLFVVHKADLGEPAERTRRDLESILALGPALDADPGWTTPVLSVSAHTGEGLEDLVGTLDAHAEHLQTSGAGEARRTRARLDRALECFVLRFGSFGLEKLGGSGAARARLEGRDGTALELFVELAEVAGLNAPGSSG